MIAVFISILTTWVTFIKKKQLINLAMQAIAVKNLDFCINDWFIYFCDLEQYIILHYKN
jgi:hypothetical protein